jgi:hypothetical protein
MVDCAIFATFVTGMVISILHITNILHLSWANLYYNIAVIVIVWALSMVFCHKK